MSSKLNSFRITQFIHSTLNQKKMCYFNFNYNSRISWLVFIIFISLETETNIVQSFIIYLLNGLMTSYLGHIELRECLLL